MTFTTVKVLSEKGQDETQVKDKFTEIITQAPYIPGQQGDYTPLESIPWADSSLVKEGLDFYSKYFSPFVASTFFAIFLGVAVKPLAAVFFRVGSLHDPEAAFIRMVKTFAGADKFYNVLLDPIQSRKHFDVIRKKHIIGGTRKLGLYQDSRPIPEILQDVSQETWKHELVAAIRKDFVEIYSESTIPVTCEEQEALDKIIVWNPSVPISQFDMVVTAFCPFASLWHSQGLFGIKSHEEIKGVVHLWAVFSRMLGIQDKFNVFIEMDTQLVEKLMQNFIQSCYRTVDETVITLQNAFITGYCRRTCGLLTYKGLLYQTLSVMVKDFKGDNLWDVMEWRDKFCVKVISSVFWMITYIPGFMNVANFLVRLGAKYFMAVYMPESRRK